MLLFVSLASAATVAVLDFDGQGVSFTDAETVTQGVRDAFLGEGALDPLSGSDIADGVSKGQDDALRRARDLVAEGRRRYSSGDAAGALAPLTEAIGLHQAAFSDVGRRPELADADFLLGLCLLKAGRSTDAHDRFAEAVALVPHYAQERGTKMSDTAAGLLAEAEQAWAAGPRHTRSAAEAGRIGDALNVDYVVTGSVDGQGAVSARMYGDGRLVAEVKGTLEELPPLPVDGAYSDLARRLAQTGHVGGAATAAVAVGDDGGDDAGEDLDADPVETPDFGEGDSHGDAPARHAADKPTSSKIRAGGSVRYEQGPITQRWWFWTGAVLVAGGGGVGLWYALSEPPTEVVQDPDVWSVTVRTE
jgi:hypothetical protein